MARGPSTVGCRRLLASERMRVGISFSTILVLFCCALSTSAPAQLSAAEPSAQARSAVRGGEPGYLGIGVANVADDELKDLNVKGSQAVAVTWVGDDSPADKAGLEPGDILLRFNNEPVQTAEQLGRLVRETPAGRKVRLLISRDGQTEALKVVVGSHQAQAKGTNPASPALAPAPASGGAFRTPGMQPKIGPSDWPDPTLSWHSAVLGVVCEGIRSQLAEYFGVKQGVLVRYVAQNSAAEKAGIKAGDVLVKVGDSAVTTPREVTLALGAQASPEKQVRIQLKRDRKEISVNVTPDSGTLSVIPWTHSVSSPEH
jgi:serine protease Do